MATDLFPTTAASDVTVGTESKFVANIGVRGTSSGSASSLSDTTVAGPTAGVILGVGAADYVWFTVPLAAVTISGTMTFNVWGFESSMNANAGFQVKVERCDGSGNVISTIVNSEHGTELGTSTAAMNWTAVPTNTTLSNGDRLKITLLANDAGGTMGSGFTITTRYDRDTAGVDGDTYVRFTETIANAPIIVAASDTLAATVGDASSYLVPIVGTDPQAMTVTEGTSAVAAVVNTTETLAATLADVVTTIAATLSRTETLQLMLSQPGVPFQNQLSFSLWGDIGGSGFNEMYAQQFTAPAWMTSLPWVDFAVGKVNSPTDSVFVELASATTGTAIATSDTVLGSSLSSYPYPYVRFNFSTPPSITPGNSYYLRIRRNGTRDTTNRYDIAHSSSVSIAGISFWSRDSNTWTNPAGASTFRYSEESAAVAIPVATSDTEAVGITDTSATEAQQAANDTAAMTMADTSAMTVVGIALAAADTGAMTLGDVATAILAALATTDTLAEAITESRSLDATVATTDTLAAAVTESRTTAVTVSTADTGALTLTDASTRQISLSGIDTAAMQITEVSAVMAALNRPDTLAMTAAEGTSVLFVTLSRPDTLALTMGNVSAVLAQQAASDYLSFAMTEARSLFNSFSTADTLGLAGVEGAAAGVFVTLARVDSLALGVIDSMGTLKITLAAVDSLTAGTTETYLLVATVSRADALALGVIDQWFEMGGDFQVAQFVSAADLLELIEAEAVALVPHGIRGRYYADVDTVPMDGAFIGVPYTELEED